MVSNVQEIYAEGRFNTCRIFGPIVKGFQGSNRRFSSGDIILPGCQGRVGLGKYDQRPGSSDDDQASHLRRLTMCLRRSITGIIDTTVPTSPPSSASAGAEEKQSSRPGGRRALSMLLPADEDMRGPHQRSVRRMIFQRFVSVVRTAFDNGATAQVPVWAKEIERGQRAAPIR